MEAVYISRDPEIMSGALCFKGTRVPVQNLFDYLVLPDGNNCLVLRGFTKRQETCQ